MQADFNKLQWFGANSNGKWHDKVALNIPVYLNGEKHYFQLDTGSPQSFVYCNALEETARHEPGKKITLSGKAGNFPFNHHFFCAPFEKYNDPVSDTKRRASGILGTDFFYDKQLLLDLKNNTFTIKGADEDEDFSRFTLLEGKLTTHLFLNVHLPEGETFKAMLNTGPAIYPVIAERKTWKKLTLNTGNASSDDNGNTHKMNAGFQRIIEMISDTCKFSTHPDCIDLKGVDVFYPKKGAEIFCFRQLGYSAILGSQLFENKGILINIAHNRFGIFEPETIDEEIGEKGKNRELH